MVYILSQIYSSMQSDVLQKYKRLQTKFSLPQLNVLEETFKFEVEEKDEVFEQIRHEMSDRVFSFTERIVEHLIGGPESLCCLYEQNMISSNERKKMFELYKKIQVLKWKNNMLLIRPNENKTAEWIKDAWGLWNDELHTELKVICQNLSTRWEDLTFKEDSTLYHG
jgi:hypothetical protein